MFPAPAGMSPALLQPCDTITYVPRTRGDEPLDTGFPRKNGICPPHRRG